MKLLITGSLLGPGNACMNGLLWAPGCVAALAAGLCE